MSTKSSTSAIFNIDASQLVVRPYPHVASDTFLDPEFYARLKAEFPSDTYFEGKPMGGRTGRDFYSTDDGFRDFCQGSPAWREFHNYINSAEFIQFVVGTFRPHLKEFACRLDPDRARFVEYAEGRHELLQRPLLSRLLGSIKEKVVSDEAQGVNDLFVRFDVEQAEVGYEKTVHCDIANRLVSLIIFFCDADEIELEGGDLRIHEHLKQKPMRSYERHPRDANTRVIKTIRPRENTGLMFLCSNNSYHSVTPVTAVKGYRRFIYLNVSSRARSLW